MDNFADRLQFAVDFRGLRQKEIAAYIGITKQAVSGWLKGLSTPSPENLKKISDYLQIDLNWLIRGNGEMDLNKTILNKVSEDDLVYGGSIFLPVVGKVSGDKYDPKDIISQVNCDKLTINSSWFYLYMFEEKLATKGSKIIWKGDLLLINPEIKDFYPGDLVVILSKSGRQWVRYVENWDSISLQLQGGIKLNKEEIAGMYRVIMVRPAEFEV